MIFLRVTDVCFLREYHEVMRIICTALDKLQNEECTYAGILWPTLYMAVKKLNELETSNTVTLCLPLIKVLKQGFSTFCFLRTTSGPFL